MMRNMTPLVPEPSPRQPKLTPGAAGSSRLSQAASWLRNGSWVPAQLSGWSIAALIILAVMLMPVATIVVLSFAPTGGMWGHLMSTVLPRSLLNTTILLLGVGFLTLVIGTTTAWLVTMHRFPGRAVIDRLLVLPLAIPTYIVAYCYAELLDYAGPVQTALRSFLGAKGPQDYWFPDIRSLNGAIWVFAAVLYPYVYLSARASFVQQSVCALEVARTLGRTPLGTFWAVALPLARPALAAGVALVLMESLNDLGAVQYLGVETLSASIYTTWLQRSSLSGAAQIATVLLILVLMLFALERLARGNAASHHTTGRYRSIPFQDLVGWRGYAAALVCLLPFALGFLVPAGLLVRHSLRYYADSIEAGFWMAAFNSLLLAAVVAAIAVILAVVLTYTVRTAPDGFSRASVRLAGLGYAVPGTVLAVGLLYPLAGIDNRIDLLARSVFGISTGLILSGTIFALVLAMTIRFLAVALGTVEAGLGRISPNLDSAARALGETALSALFRVHLPLMMPALGSAALLVFVDAMKELPVTLLLRPFNFETLATQVYGFTSLENFEQAALGALAIVAAGLVPVLLLHKAVAGGRPGSSGG